MDAAEPLPEASPLNASPISNGPTTGTYLVAGGIAGIAVDVVLFPLDTIKTRMQSQVGFMASGGFSNIYAGIGSAAIGSAPSAAIFFMTYELSKHYLLPLFPVDRVNVYAPLIHCTAAGLGEIAACLVRVPTDNIKQKRQAGLFNSSIKVVQHIYKVSGYRGFYAGYLSTIMREIPFSLVQFPLYEKMKAWRIHHHRHKSSSTTIPSWEYAVLGSISGSIAAALTTPMDVVKTRLMLLDSSVTSPSIIAVLRDIYHEGGIARLFAGIGPRVIWIGLGGAVFLGGYETSKVAIQRYYYHQIPNTTKTTTQTTTTESMR